MKHHVAHTLAKMPVLVLNPCNRCNCRCVMCDIWKRDTVEEISPAQLSAQMESIERLAVEWVVLTGGEPLMHSRLFHLCEILRARRIRVTLLSSGLLLERFAEQIVKNVDDVIVSLDGPPGVHDRIRRVDHAFARLQAGVAELRRQKADFPVAARCTVQRDNAAWLTDTAHTARVLNLNSISFLAADMTSEAFDHPPALTVLKDSLLPDLATLSAQLDKLIASGECGNFILETPGKLRRIGEHFFSAATQTSPSAPLCNAPWVSAVVEADGAVRPCFFHQSIGRITQETTLFEVVNGPRATAFRASLDVATHPTCQRCVCSLNWKPAASAAV